MTKKGSLEASQKDESSGSARKISSSGSEQNDDDYGCTKFGLGPAIEQNHKKCKKKTLWK